MVRTCVIYGKNLQITNEKNMETKMTTLHCIKCFRQRKCNGNTVLIDFFFCYRFLFTKEKSKQLFLNQSIKRNKMSLVWFKCIELFHPSLKIGKQIFMERLYYAVLGIDKFSNVQYFMFREVFSSIVNFSLQVSKFILNGNTYLICVKMHH